MRQGVLRFAFITAQFLSARPSQPEQEGRAQIPKMRERSGRQAVPQRSGPTGWHGVLAQGTPPHKSGGETETRDGSGGVTGWARAAQLAEPERASHSAAARFLANLQVGATVGCISAKRAR